VSTLSRATRPLWYLGFCGYLAILSSGIPFWLECSSKYHAISEQISIDNDIFGQRNFSHCTNGQESNWLRLSGSVKVFGHAGGI
jgi:hypothetical protein